MINAANPLIPDSEVHPDAQDPRVSRWKAVLYIIFCFELGAFLFIFPWISLWAQNFFVGRYVWVSVVARNYYVRGAISGLGLIDMFLAFHEIWRLRGLLGLIHSRPAR
jgi:hypothetical protein